MDEEGTAGANNEEEAAGEDAKAGTLGTTRADGKFDSWFGSRSTTDDGWFVGALSTTVLPANVATETVIASVSCSRAKRNKIPKGVGCAGERLVGTTQSAARRALKENGMGGETSWSFGSKKGG